MEPSNLVFTYLFLLLHLGQRWGELDGLGLDLGLVALEVLVPPRKALEVLQRVAVHRPQRVVLVRKRLLSVAWKNMMIIIVIMIIMILIKLIITIIITIIIIIMIIIIIISKIMIIIMIIII